MKDELFYLRDRKSEGFTIDELKTLVRRCFMSYWRYASGGEATAPALNAAAETFDNARPLFWEEY